MFVQEIASILPPCFTFRLTCVLPKSLGMIPTPGSVADRFVKMAQIIPAPNSPFALEFQLPSAREELFERLKALDKLQVTHPFLVVTKADIAFCFFRRIYQLKEGISDEIIHLLIDVGNAAVEAA